MLNQSEELGAVKGCEAERNAESYLAEQGLKTLQRNYRCRQGEIDLIMEDRGTLVFVEVRYRKNARFGSALESVTTTKQKKLMITAQYYLKENRLSDQVPARFDVLGICANQYEWIKSAF